MLRNIEKLKKDPVKEKRSVGSNGTNLKVEIKKTNVAQN